MRLALLALGALRIPAIQDPLKRGSLLAKVVNSDLFCGFTMTGWRRSWTRWPMRARHRWLRASSERSCGSICSCRSSRPYWRNYDATLVTRGLAVWPRNNFARSEIYQGISLTPQNNYKGLKSPSSFLPGSTNEQAQAIKSYTSFGYNYINNNRENTTLRRRSMARAAALPLRRLRRCLRLRRCRCLRRRCLRRCLCRCRRCLPRCPCVRPRRPTRANDRNKQGTRQL